MRDTRIVTFYSEILYSFFFLRKCVLNWQAHDGYVRGLTYSTDGAKLLSCSDDKTVKFWNAEEFSEEPLDTIVCKNMVSSITCQQVHNKQYIFQFRMLLKCILLGV